VILGSLSLVHYLELNLNEKFNVTKSLKWVGHVPTVTLTVIDATSKPGPAFCTVHADGASDHVFTSAILQSGEPVSYTFPMKGALVKPGKPGEPTIEAYCQPPAGSAVDWAAISAILVGIGSLATLGLAIATFATIKGTKRMTAASVEPWLTWEARINEEETSINGFENGTESSGVNIRADADESLSGYLCVRNVGSGLALIDTKVDGSAVWHEDVNWALERKYGLLGAQDMVLRTGELTVLSFTIPRNTTKPPPRGITQWKGADLDAFVGPSPADGHFAIEVVYADAIEGKKTRAVFRISSPDRNDWVVYQIDYYKHDKRFRPTFSVGFSK
jgi:hypothetical protein